MARMESTMMALGTQAPLFTLPDTVSGENISLEHDDSTKATLVMFICNHCPYVKHVNPELSRIGKEYIPKGVRIIAISSNDVARYEEDGPTYMKAMAENMSFKLSILLRRITKSRQGLRCRLYPRLFLIRCGPQTGLSRPSRQ